MKTFIIAEAGVNHNGSEDLAFALVDAAAESGADAVKFQTFSADKLVSTGTKTASYQEQQTGISDQHALLKGLELSQSAHERLFQRCQELGIEFMSTAFDEESADFLLRLGVRRLKVPSGEITNEPFLRHLALLDLPLLLSTGMADMEEIDRAVEVVRDARKAGDLPELTAGALTILHCTSNYPARDEDINLRAMGAIGAHTGLPIGYSDHSCGIAVSTAAVALGAAVIEKHFTIDPDLPGPDHKASLTPEQLGEMVRQIRTVEKALGSAEKRPAPSEIPVRALVRRSVTAVSRLEKGAALSIDDIAMMRPGDGIAPRHAAEVVGKRAARTIEPGTTLQWTDLE